VHHTLGDEEQRGTATAGHDQGRTRTEGGELDHREERSAAATAATAATAAAAVDDERKRKPADSPEVVASQQRLKPPWYEQISWSVLTLEHWLSGTIVVGLASFITLFATCPRFLLWGDFGSRGGRAGEYIELVILLVVVSIGLAKAFYTLHSMVKQETERLLMKAETRILEVGEQHQEGQDEVESAGTRTRQRS